MTVGERLSYIRSQRQESQATFAKVLGVKQPVYARYETGERKIPDSIKRELYQIGISIDWLLMGEGTMIRPETPSNGDEFQKAFPGVYSLYKDYKALKTRQGARGCKLCSKVNLMDRERSTRLEGYADALLSEQKQESKAKTLPIEEVRERQPSYKAEEELSNTPLLGRTAAGPPLDTERWPDEWRMVRLRNREDTRTHYLLAVTGTSMVDAGIPDNALILVRRAEEGRDGQIVIAHEPEEGVTLKRLAHEGERRVLQWQDGSRRCLEVSEHTRIQGIFVRVIERPEEG